MSAALNRTILMRTRAVPADTVDAGEGYLFLNGTDLYFKDSGQNVVKLNLSTEDLQDLMGVFVTSGNNRITATYNDASNTFVLTLNENNIVHQNLSGAGVNTHAQIDAFISGFNTNVDGRITLQKGAAGGLATLGADQKIPYTQIPNYTSDSIPEGTTNLYTTQARTLATVLSGLNLTTGGNIAATDTLLAALGKLQVQLYASTELQTTAVLTSASAITLSNISELGFSVTSGKRYRIQCHILYQADAATTGLALSFGSTGAAGELACTMQIPSGADGTTAMYEGYCTSFGDAVVSGNTPVANSSHLAMIHGVFVCTTGGTVYPQFRSEVSLSTVTIRVGSNIRIREF